MSGKNPRIPTVESPIARLMAARQCLGAHVGLKAYFLSGWLQQQVGWPYCSLLACSFMAPTRVSVLLDFYKFVNLCGFKKTGTNPVFLLKTTSNDNALKPYAFF